MITLIMPVILPPEILDRIAFFVKQDRKPHLGHANGVEDQVMTETATLQNLMRTSKSCHIPAEIAMYKDCLVGNVATFLDAVRPGTPFDRIERLQLFSRTPIPEPSYVQIMRNGEWDNLLFDKWGPKEDPMDRIIDMMVHQDELIGMAGAALRQKMKHRVDVLPKLKTVTLGGLGFDGWNDPGLGGMVPSCPVNPTKHIAPHVFLDLPNIESMCQYYDDRGPMALSQMIIKPEGPLRVFTHHPRPVHDQSLLGPPSQPPIIIGAINRYYSPVCQDLLATWITSTSPMIMLGILGPLIFMLDSTRTKVLSTTRRGAGPKVIELEDVDVSGTVIEFYGFVQIIDKRDIHDGKRGCCTTTKTIPDQPPLPLDRLQCLVEDNMHPKWRGKVFLKNREDAPPCPSCGLHPQSEYEDGVSTRFENQKSKKG